MSLQRFSSATRLRSLAKPQAVWRQHLRSSLGPCDSNCQCQLLAHLRPARRENSFGVCTRALKCANLSGRRQPDISTTELDPLEGQAGGHAGSGSGVQSKSDKAARTFLGILKLQRTRQELTSSTSGTGELFRVLRKAETGPARNPGNLTY